jgi:predicted  nucleic acid-binding Zn-ribbon protein
MNSVSIFRAFDKKFSKYDEFNPRIEINLCKIDDLKQELKEIEGKTGEKNTFMFLKMTDEIDKKKRDIKKIEDENEEIKELVKNFPESIKLTLNELKKKDEELKKEKKEKSTKFYKNFAKISSVSAVIFVSFFATKRFKA